MKFGKLDFEPVEQHWDLVAIPVAQAIKDHALQGILVAKIDPQLADTAAFCQKYDVGLEVSANCVVVEARRAEKTWYAAGIILATDRADVNNVVRRELDARKISFAPMDAAVGLSKMEYGGITPIGLPADWPILIDSKVLQKDHVIIGSGIRGSKLLIHGKLLASLPNSRDIALAKDYI